MNGFGNNRASILFSSLNNISECYYLSINVPNSRTGTWYYYCFLTDFANRMQKMFLRRFLLTNCQPKLGSSNKNSQLIARKMATESKVPTAAPPSPPSNKYLIFGRLAIYAYFSAAFAYFAINYTYGTNTPSGQGILDSTPDLTKEVCSILRVMHIYIPVQQ